MTSTLESLIRLIADAFPPGTMIWQEGRWLRIRLATEAEKVKWGWDTK